MPPNLERGFGEVLGGATLMETAPETTRLALAELQRVEGASINFSSAELSPLGQELEHIVNTAEELTLPVATVLVMWYGLKKMFARHEQRSK